MLGGTAAKLLGQSSNWNYRVESSLEVKEQDQQEDGQAVLTVGFSAYMKLQGPPGALCLCALGAHWMSGQWGHAISMMLGVYHFMDLGEDINSFLGLVRVVSSWFWFPWLIWYILLPLQSHFISLCCLGGSRLKVWFEVYPLPQHGLKICLLNGVS